MRKKAKELDRSLLIGRIIRELTSLGFVERDDARYTINNKYHLALKFEIELKVNSVVVTMDWGVEFNNKWNFGARCRDFEYEYEYSESIVDIIVEKFGETISNTKYFERLV